MLKCIHKIVTLLVDTLSILIHIQNYLADFFIGILDLKIYDVHKNEIQKAIPISFCSFSIFIIPIYNQIAIGLARNVKKWHEL